MALAEKHPIDKGKYQATFDDYGHGKGNGKSRNSVYKHHKKFLKEQSETENVIIINDDNVENDDFVQSDEQMSDDSVQNRENDETSSDKWADIAWDENVDDTKGHPDTIPKPIADMGKSTSKISKETQRKK